MNKTMAMTEELRKELRENILERYNNEEYWDERIIEAYEIEHPKVTKDKFLTYVRVQKTGGINMMDVKRVIELSGLTKDEILDIMENYSTYENQYLKI